MAADRSELEGLRARVEELESSNHRLSARHVEAEGRASRLTSLYVACQGLLGAVDRDDALRMVQEIIVNLIGCEQFAIFDLDGDCLRLVASSSVDADGFARVALGAGVIGRTAVDGQVRIDPCADSRGPEEGELSAAFPLLCGSRPAGAIALFRLLRHKSGFEAVDRDLIELLSAHAGDVLLRRRR